MPDRQALQAQLERLEASEDPCTFVIIEAASNQVVGSFALFPCPVLREPSCPVFIACNISRASLPLTSPTIILSGFILSDALIRFVYT